MMMVMRKAKFFPRDVVSYSHLEFASPRMDHPSASGDKTKPKQTEKRERKRGHVTCACKNFIYTKSLII